MEKLPAQMTVIGISKPGGPEVLLPETRAVPLPAADQILVKVLAAGVNRPDVAQRSGAYPPPPGASDLPGLEIAGEVVAVGSGAKRHKIGDKVMSLVAGGGYAAIVTAERWAYTVDRSVTTTMTLWAHSDGAGALVVGLGTGDPALAVYQGAEFVSAPEMNGRVLIKYGGTRYPVAPPGISATSRVLSSSPRDEVRDRYRGCYETALTALTKRFGVIPARLICNQITPGTVRMLTRLTGLSPSAVVVTGHDVGHIGPADIIVGVDRLRRAGQVDGPVAVASSTPYSFGFGLITPPAG